TTSQNLLLRDDLKRDWILHGRREADHTRNYGCRCRLADRRLRLLSSHQTVVSAIPSYRDPARVFTVFTGLQPRSLNLDLRGHMHRHPSEGQFEAKTEFPKPGTQFWFH